MNIGKPKKRDAKSCTQQAMRMLMLTTTKPSGYHVLGRAVDIACWNGDGARLLQIAIQMNLFGGYGFSFTGSNRFLHLDDREDLMIWSY